MYLGTVLAILGALLLLPCNARVTRPKPVGRSLNPTYHARWKRGAPQAVCTIVNEPPYEPDASIDNVLNHLPEYNETTKDEVLQSLILANPNITLWTIFIGRTKQIGDHLDHEKNKAWAVTKEAWHVTEEIPIHIITYMADFLKFMVKLTLEPLNTFDKIGKWFKEMGQGVKAYWHMLWNKPIKYTAEQTFGGLMLTIVDDPSAFVAETSLLIVGGFMVIHSFMHGLFLIIGALPEAVAGTLIAVLVFVHCLDDPILILAPILQASMQQQSVYLINGKNVSAYHNPKAHHNRTGGPIYDRNGTAYGTNETMQFIELPSGTDLKSFLPTLPTCRLPKTSPAYHLLYNDLCNKTSDELALIIFGVENRRNLTKAETMEAWHKFQDFTCCYGPEKLNLQVNETLAYNSTTIASPEGCTKLYGTYKSSKSAEGTADM